MYKRTKIVCTMGPACDSEEILCKMIDNGMNVARFNFSHGSHEEHLARMEAVRAASKKVKRPVGLMMDTKGPEIRTGLLKNHEPVGVKAGDTLTLVACTTNERHLGTAEKITVDYLDLPKEVTPGIHILIDDGLIDLEVESVADNEISCRVMNSGEIGERKGLNIPDFPINLPPVTSKDRKDIRFGLQNGVDFIAASFVQDVDAIEEIRKICVKEHAEHVMIFAKIESALGVKNFEKILEAADGIMIARGDLGIEIPAEKVPHIQKRIIARCNASYKPVITATQMLESMRHNPRPTRAEVADVANAIYDGTDAVMLSGETSAGDYPVEAVTMQADIAHETEKNLSSHAPLTIPAGSHGTRVVNNAVGLSAVNMATLVKAKCITIPTNTGRTARLVSHFRPKIPVVAFSPNEWAVHQMTIYWGVSSYESAVDKNAAKSTINAALKRAESLGYLEVGDVTVVTAGDPTTSVEIDEKTSSTNVIYVAQVH